VETCLKQNLGHRKKFQGQILLAIVELVCKMRNERMLKVDRKLSGCDVQHCHRKQCAEVFIYDIADQAAAARDPAFEKGDQFGRGRELLLVDRNEMTGVNLLLVRVHDHA